MRSVLLADDDDNSITTLNMNMSRHTSDARLADDAPHDDLYGHRRPELRKHKTMKTIDDLVDSRKAMENRVPNHAVASSGIQNTASSRQLLRDYEMATNILEARNRGDFARRKAHISFDHQRITMDKAFRSAPGGRPMVILESPPQSPDETVRRALRSASTAYMRRSEVAVTASENEDSSNSNSAGKKKKKSVTFLDESSSGSGSGVVVVGTASSISSSRQHQHDMDHARCNDDANGKGNGHVASPIHAACYKGEHDVVTHLLSFYTGGDALKLVNSTCSCGMTPLQVACDQGHFKVAKVLLRRQARVNKRSSSSSSSSSHHGSTFSSSRSSPVNGVAGFSLVGIGKKRQRSCVALACARRDASIVELLLEHGARVDEDALVTAASLGDASIVKTLMTQSQKKHSSGGFAGGLEKLWAHGTSASSSSSASSASSEASPSTGEIEATWISNAAAIAVANEHSAVLAALLGDGQSASSRARVASCAFEAATLADYKLLRCLTKLYDHSVLVKATDAQQNTLLHVAVKQASAKCVTLLIRMGLDVNARDALGITPLYMACARGQTAIVKLLVNAGAACERMGPNDETPLHIAAQENHLSCVLLLLIEGKSPVDITTLDKCTPLHLACQRGNTHVAKCLLDHGADINARTVCDETPLLKASRMSNMETVKLLLSRNAEVATSSTSSISSCESSARTARADTATTDYTHTASTSSSVFSTNSSVRSVGLRDDEVESEESISSSSRRVTGRAGAAHSSQQSARSQPRHRHATDAQASSGDDIFLAKSSTHTSLKGWLKSVIRNK